MSWSTTTTGSVARATPGGGVRRGVRRWGLATAEFFDADLDVAVVEVPLGDLAVEFDGGVGVAFLFEGAGAPVVHFLGLDVAAAGVLVDDGVEDVGGFLGEA